MARFGRGYSVPGVDAFLDQILAASRALMSENEGLRAGVAPEHLWSAGPDAKSGVTSLGVDAQIFVLARRGYRMREVDDLLDGVTDLLAQLEAENVALRARDPSS